METEIIEPKTVDEITKDWLIQKYHTEDLGVVPIALIFKCQSNLISAKLDEFEIPRKQKGRRKVESTTFKDEDGVEKVKDSSTFTLGDEVFEVHDRFYLVNEVQDLKKGALIEVIAVKKNEVQIRDQYTHSKKYWITPGIDVLEPI